MFTWKETQNKNSGSIGREGQVTIEIYRHSFRLRWQQQNKPRVYTVKGYITKEAYLAAINKAKLINGYLANERFDDIEKLLENNLSKHSKPSDAIDTNPINLIDLWESYKKIKANVIANSTKECIWTLVDKLLSKVSNEALQVKNADLLLYELRQEYSDGTLEKLFGTLVTVVNLAIELGKFEGKNPYPAIKKILSPNKRKKENVFSAFEIEIIIQAFRLGKYDNKHAHYSSTYYADFVEFRFLTGMRISEVIALTWDDMIHNHDGSYTIRVNKAKPGKELQYFTKTRKNRAFKSNKRLRVLIDNILKIPNPLNLVFPSIETKTYITRGNFTNKFWKPIVTTLVAQGTIKEYLPFKDTRHTYITHLVDSGMHDKAVAAICGNSPDVINSNYYRKSKQDWANIDIPEIY